MENNKHESETKSENAEIIVVEEKAAAAQVQQKDRVLPISILIAAVMIAGALVFTTLYKGGSGDAVANNNDANAGAANGAVTPSSASTTAILALSSRDAILGDANAPVTVIEYGDYQCPYCAQYYSTTQSSIISKYVNTGKVKMVFRDYPFLGNESVAAAEAAQCAEDQNKLWAYHDALYSAKLGDDGKGGTENDGTLSRTLFMSIASNLKMDTKAFGDCIDSNKYANLVAQEKADGGVLGVNSTPATIVNGSLLVDANGDSVGNNTAVVLKAIAAAVAAAK